MEGIAPLYRFIVAHLAPGLLALMPLSWLSADARAFVVAALAADSTVTQGFKLLTLALVLGLLIDGLCFVSVELLVAFIRTRLLKQPTARQAPDSLEDFTLIDQINSMHHAWMQLYVSSGAVFIFMALIVALGASPMGNWHSIWLLVIAVLLLFASARASANCERLLSAKFGRER